MTLRTKLVVVVSGMFLNLNHPVPVVALHRCHHWADRREPRCENSSLVGWVWVGWLPQCDHSQSHSSAVSRWCCTCDGCEKRGKTWSTVGCGEMTVATNPLSRDKAVLHAPDHLHYEPPSYLCVKLLKRGRTTKSAFGSRKGGV